MSQTLLYYPQYACNLNTILDASQCAPDEKADFEKNLKKANPNPLAPAYVIPGKYVSQQPHLPHSSHQILRQLTHQYGGAQVMTLAELFDSHTLNHYLSNLNTFGSNGMGAAATSIGQVMQKIHRYQDALAEYEQYRNHNAAPQTQQLYKQKAANAFKDMSRTLNHRQLQLLEKNRFKQRQVKNMTGRIVQESIPITDLQDVEKLENFARNARILGPGLIALDGGLRANKVRIMKNKNDPLWQREAVIQSASFVAGVGFGFMVGAFVAPVAGSLALILVIGGVAGLTIDYITQKLAGGLHDLAL